MRVVVMIALLGLCGCQSGGFFHEKSSGLRVDSTPDLLARFEDSKLQCNAEAAKEALASNERDLLRHNQLVQIIFEACMARSGYVVRGRA